MSAEHDATELVEAYLQADVASRLARHRVFVKTLTDLAKARPEVDVGAWARRAVDPLLDYSSLMALRRLLPVLSASDAGVPLRLAILGGPTTIQLRQLIEIFLARDEIVAEIYEADYGLFRQEILTAGSGLDRFRPDIIVLATSARDVMRSPSLQLDESAVSVLADEELADWSHLWKTANEKWNSTLIQNNFEIAPGGALGHFALRHGAARETFLERLNRLFAVRAPSYVALHDLRGLAAEAGARAWFDSRFYLEFKMPCGADCLVAYAHSIVSIVRAVLGRSKKVLALDLDNTLWGGVVGDVGSGGIRLGAGSSEGEAFLTFQQYVKTLGDRGILLAVCSKNDERNAREPFEKRQDMILKQSDFACFIANWENKADNLAAISRHLNLKLDSFVFVDDNPAERALVRRLVPEVAVPDLPDDPSGYVQALATYRHFETVAFTREDSSRAQYYAQNARRLELAVKATDLGSFLASLAMRMTVAPVTDLNMERVTQLISKSNQFNLTTQRYTLAQIREIASAAGWRTLTFSLRDALGDNGLISVILLRKMAGMLMVDTWVMSCRVLQRGVEQFARNELVELARKDGAEGIMGTYIPTARNGLVADHYAQIGFEPAGSEDGRTSWLLRIDGDVSALPHHIERERPDG